MGLSKKKKMIIKIVNSDSPKCDSDITPKFETKNHEFKIGPFEGSDRNFNFEGGNTLKSGISNNQNNNLKNSEHSVIINTDKKNDSMVSSKKVHSVKKNPIKENAFNFTDISSNLYKDPMRLPVYKLKHITQIEKLEEEKNKVRDRI